MLISKVKTLLKKLNFKDDKTLLYSFLALGAVAVLLHFLGQSDGKSSANAEAAKESFDVDTMIPAGYLLVPIQLSNSESLASLAGAFALVDLYATGEKGRKGFKVASGVKLLKAPLNPQQFAVLIREEESARLVSMEGPFFAALKNRSDSAKGLVAPSRKTPLVIHYGE